MRSGSSAQDGSGWPPRSDPHEGPGGRREVPFGPEISWPHGFRQLDQQSREVLESAYGAEPVYQQPAMDDHGYGDPGYSDPSYEGPRAPYAGASYPGGNGGPRTAGSQSAFTGSGYRQPEAGAPGHDGPRSEGRVPGYHVPERRDSVRPGYAGPGYQPRDFAAPPSGGRDIYPVTGAQEALHDTGPQPSAAPWAAQDSDGYAPTGSSANPAQWYDRPVRQDRARDGGPAADTRPADSRPSDPRLEGLRYDELHYEEPAPDGPGYDDSIEDESWYAELRRNGPAFPQNPGDQPRPSGPPRRAAPQLPAYGQPPGYPQAPAPERFPGYGPSRGDRGTSGPQLSADRTTSPGQRASAPAEPGSGPWLGTPGPARQPGPALPPGLGGQGTGFLSAPAAPVGVLTPPAGSRIDSLQETVPPLAGQFLAPPDVGRPGSATVRPGHGLDGPEITSSWPAQPPAEDLDSYTEFWQEDDETAEYRGLFGDRETGSDGARPGAKRRIGRRRGGSNDHRLWLGLGGVVIVAAAAITGIIKFEFPSHGGPVHTMVTPARIGTYARTVDLERQTNVAQLRDEVIKMSAGQASRVVSAVYESGNSAAGNTEQIIMFIGGHLANAAPATSITSFTQKFPGAKVVSPGALGGKAACVEEGSGTADSVSMCAWFDNDSFGEIVSPTMNATDLAAAMINMRPSEEVVVKN